MVVADAKVSRVDWMVRTENGSEFSGSSVVAEMPAEAAVPAAASTCP